MMYKTTDEFLKVFGYSSLEELPKMSNIEEDIQKQMLEERNEQKNEQL